MLSIFLLVSSNVCIRYGGRLYFSAKDIAGSKYLMIEPSEIVNIMFPLHFRHLPDNGGLLYFSLQLTHLNCCMENFLKFPLISLKKCFSMTSFATCGASTALILSAS